MLDGEKFEVTIREGQFNCLRDVLFLCEKLHYGTNCKFVLKSKNRDFLSIEESYEEEVETYPLDISMNMIEYLTGKLNQTKEGYYDGDGSNIKAIKVYKDNQAIKIKRIYVYAGK